MSKSARKRTRVAIVLVIALAVALFMTGASMGKSNNGSNKWNHGKGVGKNCYKVCHKGKPSPKCPKPTTTTTVHPTTTTTVPKNWIPRADVSILAPRNNDLAGSGGKGWIVDLRIRFNTTVAKTGFTPQLTGPSNHNNTAPFSSSCSVGKDNSVPGLVVLLSTNTSGAGKGQNLANFFNSTGLTDTRSNMTEILDNWIVSSADFGTNKNCTLFVAVVDDLDHDGVFDDAPDLIADHDKDGDVDALDLKEIGLASAVKKAMFFINP